VDSHGTYIRNEVKIIISGIKDYRFIINQKTRYLWLDGNLTDLFDQNVDFDLMPIFSDSIENVSLLSYDRGLQPPTDLNEAISLLI